MCGGLVLFQRQSLALLGGWDERFLDWGGEDDAMDIKVRRAGLRGVMLKDSPGFHLAHRRAKRTHRGPAITATTSHCSNNSAQMPDEALRRMCEVTLQLAGNPGHAPPDGKAGMTRPPKSSRNSAASAAPATPAILAECNIMVGTPAYGGMVHIDYLRCLFDYTRAGIRFQLNTIGNESLITRARNAILATFHVRRELTHLLFLRRGYKPAGSRAAFECSRPGRR